MSTRRNKERIRESYITKIRITKLKGISDFSMTFSKHLTCLIGENGIGKTTILHALACVYKKKTESRKLEHKLSEFFTPYSGQEWNDSKFTVDIEETTTANITNHYQGIEYKKSDRWSPRHSRKRERDTVYIGLSTCVPAIEMENSISRIDIKKVEDSSNKKVNDDIRKHLGKVMGKNYVEVCEFKHRKKEYIGIKEEDANNPNIIREYCSLSMSAGEQRCIQILRDVLKANYNSLILIEEIDVLLHQNALIRLISELHSIAKEKNHQIIFSCHNPIIEKVKGIEFRCLQKSGNFGIVCYDGFLHYNLFALTGEKKVRQRIYVEDILSKSIIQTILSTYHLSSQIEILCIGSCANAFPLLAGLHASGLLNPGEYYIVLDGDEYKTDELQQKQLIKPRYGSRESVENEKLISNIISYNLPKGTKPERYIKSVLANNRSNFKELEFIDALLNSDYCEDHHKECYYAFDELGINPEIGYNKMAELFSQTNEYKLFIEPVLQILEERGFINRK